MMDIFHCVCMLSGFSHVQLCVTLWTIALQAPLSTGILQARILEWVSMPSSRGSSQPRDGTHVKFPALAGGLFTSSTTWKAYIWHCMYLNTQKYNTKNEPLITMDFGQLHVNMGSSIVTNVPFQWEKLIIQKSVHMWKQELYGKSLYIIFILT